MADSVWKVVEAGMSLASIAWIGMLILPAVQGRTPLMVAIDLSMALGLVRYVSAIKGRRVRIPGQW